jgi:hypothetical protein
MAVTAKDRAYMETVSALGSKKAFSGKPSIAAETSCANEGWTRYLNLRTVLIAGLLVALVGVGCFALSQHARLQAITSEHNQVINSYSQQVQELTQQVQQAGILRNELDSVNQALADTSAKLTTDESALAGVNQRLSSYGFSGPVSEFASYDALIAWLKTDNTHQQPYTATFTCVDFASMMSEHAIRAGYWIFPAVDMANGHMKCIAPIGSNLYAIEPQTNDVILWAKKSY